jgi:hypothetical protein
MTTHIALIILMAFTAQGAYASMQQGMILEWLGRVLSWLPTWLHKPTHTCPVCMVSAWGIPVLYYVATVCGIVVDPYMIPVYLLASAGINWALA